MLIKRSGGKIVQDVGIDTDFVIMGHQPPEPPNPGIEADPTVIRVYDEKMDIYTHYRNVIRQAEALHVPILNTNRFLERIGYVPIKRLTYEEDY